MIRIEDVSLRAGEFRLAGMNLEVGPEYFVLLGPTGSGKTLFLKCLCGLVRAAGGRIRIDGQEVTDLEPRRRAIGYVPQDCGLFPHLSVRRNIIFSLRVRGMSRRQALGEVASLVDLLRLHDLLDRSPLSLSGGERQKVALARALAVRPRLLLLDEPVSALDEPTRRQVCAELKRVQRALGVPTLHVCHSIEEALSVADRAGVIHGGELVQTGTMRELLHRPRTVAVAHFLNAENILAATAEPGVGGPLAAPAVSRLSFAGHELLAPGRHEGPVTFMVRPESIGLAGDGDHESNTIRATLREREDRNLYLRLTFDAGIPLVVFAPRDADVSVGASCLLEMPAEAIHVIG